MHRNISSCPKAYSTRYPSYSRKPQKGILFVGGDVSVHRKGFDVFQIALKKVSDFRSYRLLVMGNLPPDDLEKYKTIRLGYIQDDRLKACVYSSADLFIIPSREDNLPNTVLESLACGTPVIGSNVGGISDMVRPNITGQLFTVGDANELANKINTFFDNPESAKQMAVNCRRIAIEEYDSSVQAKACLRVYQDILNGDG